jgi:hypothetical protein
MDRNTERVSDREKKELFPFGLEDVFIPACVLCIICMIAFGLGLEEHLAIRPILAAAKILRYKPWLLMIFILGNRCELYFGWIKPPVLRNFLVFLLGVIVKCAVFFMGFLLLVEGLYGWIALLYWSIIEGVQCYLTSNKVINLKRVKKVWIEDTIDQAKVLFILVRGIILIFLFDKDPKWDQLENLWRRLGILAIVMVI